MKRSEMFPSDFLKSEDIDNAGGEIKLTIESITQKSFEEDNGKMKLKNVVEFINKKKMICNVTNANVMFKMFTPANEDEDSQYWIGKEITLYVDENVQGPNGQTRGIRVRALSGKQAEINAFWARANELFLSPDEGRAIIKEAGGDFVRALRLLDTSPDELPGLEIKKAGVPD